MCQLHARLATIILGVLLVRVNPCEAKLSGDSSHNFVRNSFTEIFSVPALGNGEWVNQKPRDLRP
jgi:hypothetical protein